MDCQGGPHGTESPTQEIYGKGGRVLFFGEDRVVGTLGDRKNGARPGFLGARAHSVFL